jgi:hypothetical protein
VTFTNLLLASQITDAETMRSGHLVLGGQGGQNLQQVDKSITPQKRDTNKIDFFILLSP